MLLQMLVACGEREPVRELASFPYVDCGVVAPGEAAVCEVPLFSSGEAPVHVAGVEVVDVTAESGGVGAFAIDAETWRALTLEAFDAGADDDTFLLPVVFSPAVEGYYTGEVSIWSDDDTSLAAEEMRDGTGAQAVWKVQLRGNSWAACGRLWPTFIDLGRREEGGSYLAQATVQNCGLVTLRLFGYSSSGDAISVEESFPTYEMSGTSIEIGMGVSIPADTDGMPTSMTTLLTLESNATFEALTVIANDCTQSVEPSWDADADGWFVCGGDCDDDDDGVNPSAVELPDNGQDDDCDEEIDELGNDVDTDDDQDGYTEGDGDCDDADADVYPGALEIVNQIDDDCNGLVDDATERYDDDGDGFSERAGDCDDANTFVSPAIQERLDGVDNDCDGVVDEGTNYHDDDGDSFQESEDLVADDCDDTDPWTYVGAFEFCDGVDNDCDRLTDEGEDDGVGGACAYPPERRQVAAGGCDTTSGVGSTFLALAGALLSCRWRRRCLAQLGR